MQKFLFVIIVFCALLFVGGWFFLAPYNDDIVIVEKDVLFLQNVYTREEMEVGLGGRESMCDRCGMLFVFDTESEHNFWMKGMLFDLDIIWISRGEIVHIERSASHLTPEKAFAPGVIADKVLEIPAGRADAYGLDVGDVLQF